MVQKLYKTLFWQECRIEIRNEVRFEVAFEYTNASYDDEYQIYLAFGKWIWITWWDYTGNQEPVRYWFRISKDLINVWYGHNDYFEEHKNCKNFRFYWSRITDFFLGKEKQLWEWEKFIWRFPMKMDRWDEYVVKVTTNQLYSWRPRWFWRKLHLSWECTPDRWIPHEGKGENSWDCWPDATQSMSTSGCSSPEEAVQELKKSCERDRAKYWDVPNIEMFPESWSPHTKELMKNNRISPNL